MSIVENPHYLTTQKVVIKFTRQTVCQREHTSMEISLEQTKNNKLHLLILFWNNGTLRPTKLRSNWKIPLFTDATDQILFLPSYFNRRFSQTEQIDGTEIPFWEWALFSGTIFISLTSGWQLKRGNAFVSWFCINTSDTILSKQLENKIIIEILLTLHEDYP